MREGGYTREQSVAHNNITTCIAVPHAIQYVQVLNAISFPLGRDSLFFLFVYHFDRWSSCSISTWELQSVVSHRRAPESLLNKNVKQKN